MSFRLYNVQHTIVGAKHIKNWMHASNFSAVHWAIETPVAKACVGEGWEIREIKQLLPKMSEQLSDECFFFPFSVFVSFWFDYVRGRESLQNIDKKRCDEMIMEICLHVEAMGAVFQKYLKIYDPLTSLVMPRKEKKHVMWSFGGGLIWQQGSFGAPEATNQSFDAEFCMTNSLSANLRVAKTSQILATCKIEFFCLNKV